MSKVKARIKAVRIAVPLMKAFNIAFDALPLIFVEGAKRGLSYLGQVSLAHQLRFEANNRGPNSFCSTIAKL